VTAVPLRRNRDFLLLQIGQLLSGAGSQLTSIAYPLLVLAVTGSATKAGAVWFARTLPLALLALPGGVAADRWNRKRLMIAADGVRVVAIGCLAAAILLGRIGFWAIVLVAVVEGIGTALFSAAQAGALRAVVPGRQLPAAVGAQTGRQAAVQLAGPPLGGALFGLAHALPFSSTTSPEVAPLPRRPSERSQGMVAPARPCTPVQTTRQYFWHPR
jgi:MFS family permease